MTSPTVEVPQPPRRVLVVGYSAVIARGLQWFRPDDSVIFIEEASQIRRKDAAAILAGMPCCSRLVEWDYLREGSADEFYERDVLGELPAAVLSGGEYGTIFVARLAERYGLPGASVGAARLMRDKDRLRAVTAAAGVPNPISRRAESAADITALLDELGGPVIVKPSAQQGAAGVSQVSSAAEAATAFRFATEGDEGGEPAVTGTNGHVLVEQYVAGPEFSVELLVEAGQPIFANVTAKTLFDGPRPIERGHVLPVDDQPELVGTLTELTGAVVAATGFDTGIVHCEWIVGKDGPMLVECAGRIPGDGITVLLSVAWGVDLVELYVAMMERRLDRSRVPQQPAGRAAVAFSAGTPGTVTAVTGETAAAALDGVLLVLPLVAVDDQVRELRSSADRVAMAFAAGSTTAEATSRAEAAVGLVTVATS